MDGRLFLPRRLGWVSLYRDSGGRRATFIAILLLLKLKRKPFLDSVSALFPGKSVPCIELVRGVSSSNFIAIGALIAIDLSGGRTLRI
jgi:hypothetical protein